MHTVELLEQAIDLSKRLGFSIRQEWLAGEGGGGCEIQGRKVLFLDLSQGPADQLDTTIETLRHEPEAAALPMPHQLRELLQVRKSA